MTPHRAGPRSRLRFALFLAAAIATPVPAAASGTLGAGSGGDPYALGKRVYLQRLACADCPVPSGADSAEAARTLIDRVQRDEFSLRPREQRAVVAYLKRRWRLQ
jgi:hypothetical protein